MSSSPPGTLYEHPQLLGGMQRRQISSNGNACTGATAGKASYPHLQRLYGLTLHLIHRAVRALQGSTMGGKCQHCRGVIQRVHMLRGQKRGRALACRAQLSAADSSPQHSNVRRSAAQRSAAQLMPHVAFRLDDRLRIGSQPLAPARHLLDVGDRLACRHGRQGSKARQAVRAGGRVQG